MDLTFGALLAVVEEIVFAIFHSMQSYFRDTLSLGLLTATADVLILRD